MRGVSGDYAASVSDIHSVTSRLSQVSVSLIEFNKNYGETICDNRIRHTDILEARILGELDDIKFYWIQHIFLRGEVIV